MKTEHCWSQDTRGNKKNKKGVGSKSGLIEIKILKVMQLIVMARSRVWLWEWETEMRWRTRLLKVSYFRNRKVRVVRALMKKLPRTLPGLGSGERAVNHLLTSQQVEGIDQEDQTMIVLRKDRG